jgi:hypothetical protein
MTTTHINGLNPCPACNGSGSNLALLPELPPLPVGALLYGVAELLDKALDLPQPRYVTVSSTQHIGLQFDPDRSSFAAIAKWSLRFGGVLVSTPRSGEDGPQTLCRLEFDYFGVPVEAYAIIPAGTATT